MMEVLLGFLIYGLICSGSGASGRDWKTSRDQPWPGQRCDGRQLSEEKCCSAEAPCEEGEGDCHKNDDCAPGLKCGTNNCLSYGTFYQPYDDCCEPDPAQALEPPAGQRCRGRNYDGKRCCTPEQPCQEGEGDCDGPGDGGRNDGHAGCAGELICGSNNCRQFGLYYHPKDDCCERPSSRPRPPPATSAPVVTGGVWQEPPPGEKCSGRNYQGRRCCTPESPCDVGQGDCDGPADGGAHDGHRGCRAGLVCGSNNCRQFGAYFHQKDDCCERPGGGGGKTDLT